MAFIVMEKNNIPTKNYFCTALCLKFQIMKWEHFFWKVLILKIAAFRNCFCLFSTLLI